MGKGGSAPSKTTSTQTTSNIPEYAKPYFTDILNRTKALSSQEYVPYEAERIAGFTPEQQALQQQTLAMQAPSQFGAATNMAQAAGQASMTAGQYTPGQFYAQTVTPEQLQYFQMAGPEAFGQEQAQQYMSPYFQNVLDVQKQRAIEDAQKAQLMQNLGAAREGTYGGARQLLAGTQRERALAQQLGDIQAAGLQSAYENAQQQFERDRAARIGAQRANLEAALGVQQLGAQTGLQAALANQQYGLEAQRLGEQSRQFGAETGLRGLAQALQGAQTLGQLGEAQQAADLRLLQAQQAAAAAPQQLQQRELDLAYADFLRQRDYPMEMLGYYSNILRGLPIQLGSTATTYAPPPSASWLARGLVRRACLIFTGKRLLWQRDRLNHLGSTPRKRLLLSTAATSRVLLRLHSWVLLTLQSPFLPVCLLIKCVPRRCRNSSRR